MSYFIFSALILPGVKKKYPGEKILRLAYTYERAANTSKLEVETDQGKKESPETESKAVNDNKHLQTLFDHYKKTYPNFTKIIAVLDTKARTVVVYFFENENLLSSEKI